MMPVSIPPFVPPEFLQNQDVETIHRRMMDNLPADWDKSEGQWAWNSTRPTAIEKAELVQQVVYNTLQLMHPQFATGIFLDLHGQSVGVFRLPATLATGEVTFQGTEGTTIPQGTIVSTVASEDSPSVQFVTTEWATIDETGQVTVPIQAIEAGTVGNVPAGAIQVLVSTVSGVTAVTNEEATTGGTEEEDDEAYRFRIMNRNQNKSLSGAKRDYERWAMEVPGVGGVKVLPEADGPGTVKILVVDANGQPANQTIIEAVQQHIAPNGRSGDGLAPIGALVTVAAPVVRSIDISVTLQLESGYDLPGVVQAIKDALTQYFIGVGINGMIRYHEVGAIVIGTDGVLDYSGLQVDGGTTNIQLGENEMAEVGMVNATT